MLQIMNKNDVKNEVYMYILRDDSRIIYFARDLLRSYFEWNLFLNIYIATDFP